jgi:hypothetical protein
MTKMNTYEEVVEEVEVVEDKTSKSKFPLEVLPEKLHELILQGARSFSIPVDVVYLVVLNILATSIGGSIRVSPKRDWLEPIILWVILIGRSGSGKSPFLNFFLKPLREIQRSNTDQAVIITDTTIEALAEALKSNPKGVMLFKDEFAGFFKTHNQYRKGDDTEKYLELWNGSDLNIRRKSVGNIYVNSPICNLLGGMQPEVVKEHINQKTFSNGLASRFLYVDLGKTKRKYRRDNEISEELTEYWNELITNLYALPADQHVIPLDDTASTLFEHHYTITADREEHSGMNKRTFMPKLSNYCLRLMGILHVLKYDGEEAFQKEIDFETVRDSAQLLYFIEEEMDSFLSKYILDKDDHAIYKILDKAYFDDEELFIPVQSIVDQLASEGIEMTNEKVGNKVKSLGFNKRYLHGKSQIELSGTKLKECKH